MGDLFRVPEGPGDPTEPEYPEVPPLLVVASALLLPLYAKPLELVSVGAVAEALWDGGLGRKVLGPEELDGDCKVLRPGPGLSIVPRDALFVCRIDPDSKLDLPVLESREDSGEAPLVVDESPTVNDTRPVLELAGNPTLDEVDMVARGGGPDAGPEDVPVAPRGAEVLTEEDGGYDAGFDDSVEDGLSFAGEADKAELDGAGLVGSLEGSSKELRPNDGRPEFGGSGLPVVTSSQLPLLEPAPLVTASDADEGGLAALETALGPPLGSVGAELRAEVTAWVVKPVVCVVDSENAAGVNVELLMRFEMTLVERPAPSCVEESIDVTATHLLVVVTGRVNDAGLVPDSPLRPDDAVVDEADSLEEKAPNEGISEDAGLDSGALDAKEPSADGEELVIEIPEDVASREGEVEDDQPDRGRTVDDTGEIAPVGPEMIEDSAPEDNKLGLRPLGANPSGDFVLWELMFPGEDGKLGEGKAGPGAEALNVVDVSMPGADKTPGDVACQLVDDRLEGDRAGGEAADDDGPDAKTLGVLGPVAPMLIVNGEAGDVESQEPGPLGPGGLKDGTPERDGTKGDRLDSSDSDDEDPEGNGPDSQALDELRPDSSKLEREGYSEEETFHDRETLGDGGPWGSRLEDGVILVLYQLLLYCIESNIITLAS